MTSNKHILEILNDVDDFIQREGLITNKLLIRSKLRLLNNITPIGKTKTIVRGLLIRLNRLTPIELTLRVLDIIKTMQKTNKGTKTNRKLQLNRFTKPVDLRDWFSNENFPLQFEN
jgi:hypothetical protein